MRGDILKYVDEQAEILTKKLVKSVLLMSRFGETGRAAGKLYMLMEFYGKECGHCKKMEPLIDKLEQELGVKVQRMEIWHDENNEKKWSDESRGICQGVPFFVNTETQKTICGEASYEEFKAWAKK